MPGDRRHPIQDLTLRAAGLLFLLAGALALCHLAPAGRPPGRHEASAGEMILAAIGFMGLSFGSGITMLGAHIFEEVEVSPRWRKL